MNQAIRNTWIAIMVLFLAIMGSLTYVQFFAADELNANPLNRRQLYQDFDMARGAILVDGSPIAESVRTDQGQFEYQRVYHDAQLYSHLTGFYSLAAGSTHLESVMDEYLAGRSDEQAFDRLLNLFTGSSTEGASVELTIDGQLQQEVYDILPDDVPITAVVTEVETGNIKAMVSKPSYDTNLLTVPSTGQAQENLQAIEERPGFSPYRNPAIADVYAPGSTFKVLDLVAASESGEYDVDSTVPNPPSLEFPGTDYTINNFDRGICARQPDEAPLRFVVAQSCNTPFAQMAEAVGEDALRDVAERFGFGQPLNIPQRVEPSVFPQELSTTELAQASIGQFDVRTTALQMNMVAMGIANDGVIMKPNLIEQIIAPDLKVIEDPQPEEFSTATTKEVADQVTELMREPLDGGTAAAAQVRGLDIAAKTGTAQTGRTDENGNPTHTVNSWITGFAPADDPQYAVTIMVPNIDYETGHSLTSPNMKKILEAVFNK
ncbi:penicillin-binding transpeptidase domain-containing protein [Zhihengliuella alba]|uniref:Penicillin-binding transpeptidase domain-containing protein n=1 Tax=Zhihengliuella alba TaxID=547018 RepID=A0ABP7DMD7_9MICC